MPKPNKTTENNNSVEAFLATVKDAGKRKDTEALIDLIRRGTRLEPKMWGTAIVGFGSYHYVYESGREGDAPMVGLSPRANAISLYLANLAAHEDLMARLGKVKAGKGCVYVKQLEDIDTTVLLKLAKLSIDYLKKKYPAK